MSEAVLHVVAENPEEPHVAQEVHPAAVQEDARQHRQYGRHCGRRKLTSISAKRITPPIRTRRGSWTVIGWPGLAIVPGSSVLVDQIGLAVLLIAKLQQKHNCTHRDHQDIHDRRGARRDVVAKRNHGLRNSSVMAELIDCLIDEWMIPPTPSLRRYGESYRGD